MASLGIITIEEAERLYIELFERLEYIRRNIHCIQCVGYHDNGDKCTYRKKPHSLFCKRCGYYPEVQINRCIRRSIEETITIHKSALMAARMYCDIEEIEMIVSMINELIYLLKNIESNTPYEY